MIYLPFDLWKFPLETKLITKLCSRYYDLLTFVNDQYDENKSNHLIDVDDFDEDSDSNFENLKEFVGQVNFKFKARS